MINFLLLSNQLIDPDLIAGIFRSTPIKIFLYKYKGFFKINGNPITDTKKKYFLQCIKEYISSNKKHDITLITTLQGLKNIEYNHFDFMDFDVEDECKKYKLKLVKHHNPMFLLDYEQRDMWVTHSYPFVFGTFYKWCRKTLNLYPKPIGGKWTYDESNQNRLPEEKQKELPKTTIVQFPTNRNNASHWLHKYMETKLELFGPYQDAISRENVLLWHSGISPMLNLGLLLPSDVISLIPDAKKWNAKNISSYEGFFRQLIWREYMAMIYRVQVKIENIFKSNKSLPVSWYKKQSVITGLEIIDEKINQTLNCGYLHHIERLMLVGNFMLLASIKPVDVYDWFMRCFVDAHHWVMVGNVYHMLLWASGRIMTQRPYIASVTYLKRMVTHISAEDCALWDKYYAKFIISNLNILKHTYMMTGHIKRAKMLMGNSK